MAPLLHRAAIIRQLTGFTKSDTSFLAWYGDKSINKCVSRLARCKSHNTALSNTGTSNSEWPMSLVRNSEPLTSLGAHCHR